MKKSVNKILLYFYHLFFPPYVALVNDEMTPGTMFTGFLCLLCLGLCGATKQDDFIMNRVRVMKNTEKQCSVRLHGNSPDLTMFHAILRFSSPINTAHNSLFIDQSSVVKYQKIMQEERQELSVRSREVKKILSYHTIADNATDEDVNDDGYNDRLYDLIQSVRFLGGRGGLASEIAYDGVLLLDAYSAIWSEYNVAIFTPNQVTFRYVQGGLLTQKEDEEVAYYNGLTLLPCDATFNSDRCLLDYHEGVEVNGRLFPTYRIILDLDSPRNLLPIDLYLMWSGDAVVYDTLSIRLEGDNWLHLNGEFQYEMHQSNIILLGVDVLHHFPRLEYSVKQRAYQVWYHRERILQQERHEAIKILFMFFNLALIWALFLWCTSYNYLLLEYLIEFACVARHLFYFAYKQCLYEVLVMSIATITVAISLAVPQTASPEYHARKELFIWFLLYYLMMAVILLALYSKVCACAWKHYFPRFYGWCRRKPCKKVVCVVATTLPYAELFADLSDRHFACKLHKTVVALYHDPLAKLPTVLVIMRNTSFISILLLSMALLYNFYTPLNSIYLALIAIVSLALIYYQIKHIIIGILYLVIFRDACRTSECEKLRANWLLVYVIIQAAATFLYIWCASEPIYVHFFNTINSTHSQVAVQVYVTGILAVIVVAPMVMASLHMDKYADPLIECVLEKRRCSVC